MDADPHRVIRWKPVREERCFVQFLHPGGEHEPDFGKVRTWNRGAHRRKFVRYPGRVVSSPEEVDLVFWCEWEPPSDVVRVIPDPLEDGPRFLYHPYWTLPSSFRGLQNTDPCVFGGFFYSNCRQTKSTGPTQLRYLRPGSVLLFGSHRHGRFVLDTVFVVSSFVDYTSHDYRAVLKGLVPDDYPTAALQPLFASDGSVCGAGVSLRLYVGATKDKPFEGMHSFFPCQRYERGTRGFERPAIELPGIVNPECLQAGPLNRGVDPERFLPLWQSVHEQVLEHGCEIGVAARFPERR